MAEQNLFCLCGRCSRKLRSAAARRVGMGSTCCRKETGKTITQLLKELDEQEAAAAAEQQEPDSLYSDAAVWWLRSPNTNNTNNVWNVNSDGSNNNWNYNNSYGVRPALMEP